MTTAKPKHPATELIHHPYKPPQGFEAVVPGVHKASTVLFPDVEALRTYDWKDKNGYTYGLHGTPTTFTLEERIATLEGGEHCMLAPSGLAVISLVDMALLRQGDEVLLPDNAYGPGKVFAEVELEAWGITHRFYDAMDPDDLARQIGPATRLVWLEAAGSITLEYPDIPALVEMLVQRASRHFGLRPPAATPADLALLAAYDWPGNVRELGSVIDRAVILGGGRHLDVAKALGTYGGGTVTPATGFASPPAGTVPGLAPAQATAAAQIPGAAAGITTLDEAMARHIRAVLAATQGRIEGPHGAAKLLKINPHTLRARMRKLGIDWQAFRPER